MSRPLIMKPSAYCENRKTTPQLLANGVQAVVVFTDADLYDNLNFHDPLGANPERFIIPIDKPGLYHIDAYLECDLIDGGIGKARILDNLGNILCNNYLRSRLATECGTQLSCDVWLNGGDYIVIDALQNGVAAGLNIIGRITLTRTNSHRE